MFKTRGLSALTLAWVVLLFVPGFALAETFKGTIVGHSCAHQGKKCPAGKLDPHVALEPDFVLMQGEDDYLFMPNLPRDVKVRYVLDTVTVKGALTKRYSSVTVDELMVGGKTVWSQKEQQYQIDCVYDETCQFAN